jgi:hypothetical protein
MARAKKGLLPFVVQPKIDKYIDIVGTETAGKIEIERRGYLSVSEKAIVQGSVGSDPAMAEIYTLSSVVARAKKKKPTQVLKDMMQADRPAYLAEYDGEISQKLLALVAYQEKVAIIQATALLMGRIDPEWTVEKTLELHPELIEELSKFYVEEETKSNKRIIESAEKQDGNGVAEGKS